MLLLWHGVAARAAPLPAYLLLQTHRCTLTINRRANDTAPELRRYALSALLPPQLAAPTASLLERLPDSICSLPRDSVERLPVAFKAQVCGPLGLMLRQLAGVGSGGNASGGGDGGGVDAASEGVIASGSSGGVSYASTTWATALAEVAMAGGGSGSSGGAKARVDEWVLRMCRWGGGRARQGGLNL